MLNSRFATTIGVLAVLQGMAASGGAAAGAATQQAYRTGVDVIEVAVVVRDSAGRMVSDLTSADFSVLDNGEPQRIVGLERIALPVVRPSAQSGPTSLLPPRDVTTNETVDDARVFVLVLDALHIAAGRNLDVRATARQFIEQHVGPHDLVAVLAPGADPSATQDFTADKARLTSAIDNFTGTKLKSATEELTQFRSSARLRDPSDEERADRVYSLTNTLEAVAAHLDRIEGRRKALLLFSEGIDYDTSDVTGKQQRYASDVTRAMARAVGALARTNVVLYTIDPRGLTSVQNDLLEHPIWDRSPGSDQSLSERDFEREVSSSIRSLRDLAQATGGFFAADKGVARAFEQIVEETSQYYVLRYTPNHPPTSGEFRKIRVRVSRPAVTVIARHGYVMPRPDDRSARRPPITDDALRPMGAGREGQARPRLGTETRTVAPSAVSGVPEELSRLLASALPKSGLPLRVQAVPFRGTDKKSEVRLVVEVLGGGLQFEQRDGHAEERLEIALVTVDERGRLSNGRSTAIDLRLPPGEQDRVRLTGVRVLSELDLPAGRHQLRVAARAIRTGAAGMVTHTVDVPRFERGRLSMSGVTITSLPALLMPTRGKSWLEASLETPPSAARVFVQGDRLAAAIEVYAPDASLTSVESFAELVPSVGPSRVRLTSRGTGVTHGSSREVAFGLDTATLTPGAYVLRVVVVPADGSEPVERRVALEIAAGPIRK
jgi:VWFA-related protein